MDENLEETLQDAHPEGVLLLAELLGNISSYHMPFNVQNLIGNWLKLIGQIILVFNAQQQFWQNGPGHYYSRCNKNIYSTTPIGDYTAGYRNGGHEQQILEEITALRIRLEQLEQRL